MRKKIELVVLLLALAGLIVLSNRVTSYVSQSVSGTKVENKKQVILDPGHGGSDPGKVGVNDALEKDINLQIAGRVKKLLEKEGIEVVMTRETDETLAEKGEQNQKVQDMKARVKLINSTAPSLVVSIHQNSYSQENVKGAQVFYYTNSQEGEKAAAIMQKALLTVDSENHRQPKANDTYYLLKRTEVPTIIVECGFLSNWEEAEKLLTEDYQKAIANAITDGILACLSE